VWLRRCVHYLLEADKPYSLRFDWFMVAKEVSGLCVIRVEAQTDFALTQPSDSELLLVGFVTRFLVVPPDKHLLITRRVSPPHQHRTGLVL